MNNVCFCTIAAGCIMLSGFPVFALPACIAGKLTNFSPELHQVSIGVEICDIFNSKKQYLAIAPDGAFEAVVNIRDTVEIRLIYDGVFIPLLLVPGDSLFISFDAGKVSQDYMFLKDSEVDGVLAQTNKRIFDVYPEIIRWLDSSTGALGADKLLTDLAYQRIRLSELDQQLKGLSTWMVERQVDDVLFQSWADAQLRYQAGKDLAIFPFAAKINSVLSDTAAYFHFAEQIPVDNWPLRYLWVYQEFLRTMESSLEIMGNLNTRYFERAQQLQQTSGLSKCLAKTAVGVEAIQRWSNGIGEDYLLSAFIHRRKIKCPDVLTQFDDLLRQTLDPERREFVLTVSENGPAYNMPALVERFSAPETVKRNLREMVSSAAGKPVFINFWMAGCAPCMQELPNYNSLIDSLHGLADIVFLGAYMTEEHWERTRTQLNLKGRHYLLGKNEVAFFEQYCQLQGFPHHVLLQSNGELEAVGIYSAKTSKDSAILLDKLKSMIKN